MNNKLIFRKIHGFKMGLFSDDPGISRVLRRPLLWRRWHREPEFMDLISDSVKPGDTVFDLGANIGYASLLMAKRLQGNGSMICVEPSTKNFNLLKLNLTQLSRFENLNLIVQQLAIGNRSGKVRLSLSDQSNMNSILIDNNNQKSEQVNIQKFDDLVDELAVLPSFIKMDVEGAEIEVVAGMEKFLSRVGNARILMEVHPQLYESKKDVEGMLNLLKKSSFNIRYLVSASAAILPSGITYREYEPTKVYKDGKYKRGLYENVSFNDLLKLILNDKKFRVKIHRTPSTMFQKQDEIYTSKCVRAVLFEKRLS